MVDVCSLHGYDGLVDSTSIELSFLSGDSDHDQLIVHLLDCKKAFLHGEVRLGAEAVKSTPESHKAIDQPRAGNAVQVVDDVIDKLNVPPKTSGDFSSGHMTTSILGCFSPPSVLFRIPPPPPALWTQMFSVHRGEYGMLLLNDK